MIRVYEVFLFELKILKFYSKKNFFLLLDLGV